MMNSPIKSFSLLAVMLLIGCSPPTSRITDYQTQDASHNIYYLTEQQHQTVILSTSEAQVSRNMEATQHVRAAKKAVYRGSGMTFGMSSKNFIYPDDSLCTTNKDDKDATIYQSGLCNVVVHRHVGKIALMKESQFVGCLK